MEDVVKVHDGLKSVEVGTRYHLGYYEIEFSDGSLTFQLHARLCTDEGCPCDNLQIDWMTEESVNHTWFTGDHRWLNAQMEALNPELEHVCRIAEGTDLFRERYQHMMYLRRKQVLEQNHRHDDPFTIYIPDGLLAEDSDLEEGFLGQVQVGKRDQGQTRAYRIEFCGDPECYCTNLMLHIPTDDDELVYVITLENEWFPADENKKQHETLLAGVRNRLMGAERFRTILGFFRSERMLENYHRFVKTYETHRREAIQSGNQ